jgi:hypothetical protein
MVTDPTRQIGYIEDDEDFLEKEAEWASQHTMEELLYIYCKHIAANYAMAGIDIKNYPVERVIYYIEDEQR